MKELCRIETDSLILFNKVVEVHVLMIINGMPPHIADNRLFSSN